MTIYLTAEELDAICGKEGAHKLLVACGGTRVYVPARFADDHPLIAIMGEAAALALSADICCGRGGAEVHVPLGGTGARARAREELRALIAAGLSAATIARRLGISRRTVFREKRRQRLEARQKGSKP